MTLTAITRGVSPVINDCELGFLPRQEIDLSKAVAQHQEYEACLRDLGVGVVSLPPEPDLPDSMFVEDPAVVVDEVDDARSRVFLIRAIGEGGDSSVDSGLGQKRLRVIQIQPAGVNEHRG